MIGWFVSDAIDAVGDVASSAWDDVVDTIPGGRAFVDGVDAILVGPVRDFAQTGVGRAMLSALASSVTGGLAPYLGAQLATVAFALPGMAAGQDFVTAWTQELGSRVKQTADILGADVVPAEWGDQLKKATDFVNKYDIPWDQIDFHTLAKQAGVREDVAAWLVAGATQKLATFTDHHFDPQSGKDLGLYETPQEVLRRATDASIRAKLLQLASIRQAAYTSSTSAGAAAQTAVRSYLTHSFADPHAAQAAASSTSVHATNPDAEAASSGAPIALGIAFLAGAAALAYYYLR